MKKTLLFLLPLLLLFYLLAYGQTTIMQWAGADPIIGPSYRTVSTPVLGAELVTDPGFDVDANWSKDAGWTVSGSEARAAAVVQGLAISNTTASAIPGTIIKTVLTVSDYTAGAVESRILAVASGAPHGSAGTFNDYILHSGGAPAAMALRISTGVDATLRCSSISAKQVLLSSLLAPTRPFQGTGRFYVTATTANCAAGEWLGTAAYLDSTTSPTKGLFAYVNRTTGNAELRVLTAANTWTSLINTAFTFVSGQILRFDYNATTKVGAIYYNNIQLGANQDLSAYTWIANNRRHAIFSTTAVNPDSVVYRFVKQ